MKKHILVISQCFWPEQFRINDICAEWVKRGFKVTVLTAIPNYPKGVFYKGYGLFKKRHETHDGYDIIRLPIVPRLKGAFFMVLNYYSFVISGYFWSLFSRLKPDFIFNYESSPMTQALIGVWFAKRRKIPFYLYVTDLWPHNVQYVGNINSTKIINYLHKTCDYIYNGSTEIFTSARGYIGEIMSRGIPESKIHFWPQYAQDFYIPLEEPRFPIPNINKTEFNIIFAGNVGMAQGLGTLPESAKILKSKEIKCKFVIIGNGRYKEELLKRVKESGTQDFFTFIDMRPEREMSDYMAACDVALVPLSKNDAFSKTLPSKTPSSMACGKPILVYADGEIQDVIKNANAGACATAENFKELADAIEYLVGLPKEEIQKMGINARRYYEENYEKSKMLDIMDAYFEGEKKDESISI